MTASSDALIRNIQNLDEKPGTFHMDLRIYLFSVGLLKRVRDDIKVCDDDYVSILASLLN